MAINFNTGPYFDDFDKNKNFYKVLFKPGYAVQARELNQLQSIQQHQLAGISNHIFKKNSMVIPGGIVLNNKADIIFVSSTSNINLAALVGKTITNKLSFDYTDDATLDGYITAVVQAYRPAIAATDNQDAIPACLYVKYFKAMTDAPYRNTFDTSEVVKTVDAELLTFTTDADFASRKGKVATLSAGVFYTNEYFVDAANQTIIVEHDTLQPTTASIVLDIQESIVTSDTDESLLDNATGAPNEYAPGADRYKIDLVLTKVDVGFTSDRYINLMTIENDVITYLNDRTEYAELMKTLARRMYDANGNFVTSGLQTSLSPSSDDNYIIASATAGKAYIGGFEYNQIANQSLPILKPRDVAHTESFSNVASFVNSLPYFYIAGGNRILELPDENTLVQILDADPAAAGVSVIGYGVYRGIQYVTGDINTNEIYKAFFDWVYLEEGHTTKDIGGFKVISASQGAPVLHEVTVTGQTGLINIDDVITSTTSGLAVTFQGASADTVTLVDHGFIDGDQVSFSSIVTTTGISINTIYYVLNATDDTFQLESSIGGGKLELTSNGSGVLKTQTGTVFHVTNNILYVRKHTLNPVPSTDTIFTNAATLVFANITSYYISDYTSDYVPMIKVDNDPIKTLYDTSLTPAVPTTTYSYINRYEFTITSTNRTITQSLGTNETFEDFSTSDYYAYNVTDATFITDLVNYITIDAGEAQIQFEVTDSSLDTKTIWLYTTVNKTNIKEAVKTETTVTTQIVTPSKSWMALDHQDVVSITKVVDGGVKAVTFTDTGDLVTLEAHGLVNTDQVMFKSVTSTTGITLFKKYYVINKTDDTFQISLTSGGSAVALTTDGSGVMCPPADIDNDTDITNRFHMLSGNTGTYTGTGFIKLNPKATAPVGQIAVRYKYYEVGTGNYMSVDSYGDYTGDLGYIGDIQNVSTDKGFKVNPRNYIDFRTRTSSYFFKNFATIASGSAVLKVKDLNLSTVASLLVGKYVVGPGFDNSVVISSVAFNSTTGDSEITLGSSAGAAYYGTYYIGLHTTSLNLADTSYGGKEFTFPKDSARLSYSYTRFKSKQVLIYVDRNDEDATSLKQLELTSLSQAEALRRNEYKLPLMYVHMQPYTLSISDVAFKQYDNPTYQMLDIHNIKERVDRNEYYTLLALTGGDLTATNDDSELEVSDRGFWSENFMNAGTQDYLSPDYKATIYDKTYVSPGVRTTTVNLEIDKNVDPATWQQTGTALTLPYRSVRAFGNTAASRGENLNPYNNIEWTASAKLTLIPSVDNWVDVTVAPTPVEGDSESTPDTEVIPSPPPPLPETPPVILPKPPVEEIVTEVTNIKAQWGKDSKGGNHGITFDWKTNTGRTGRVNTDSHLAEELSDKDIKKSGMQKGKININKDYALSMINKRYNDPGVKEYLNAGTHFDQHPPEWWKEREKELKKNK